MDELFETTTNKGPLWNIILNVLSEFATFKLTAKDVQKKYHNLTTTYHRNKERAETKGPEAVTWEHFEIFDQIIGERTKLEINQSLQLQADEEAKKQELKQVEVEPPPPPVTNTLFSGEYIPSKRKRKATHRYVEEIQVKEAEHKEKVKKEMEKRLSERKELEKLQEEEQRRLMQFRSDFDRRPPMDHVNNPQRNHVNNDRRRLDQNSGQGHITPQQQQQQRIQQQRQQQIKQQRHQHQQMINANNANIASNSNITLTSIGGNSTGNTPNRLATPASIGNVTIMRLSEKERIWRDKKALEEKSLVLQERRIAVEERKAKALEGLKSVVSEFLRRFEH